jgi:hypothetical protein
MTTTGAENHSSWVYDHPLFQALRATDLHHRLVSVGIDGSITTGRPQLQRGGAGPVPPNPAGSVETRNSKQVPNQRADPLGGSNSATGMASLDPSERLRRKKSGRITTKNFLDDVEMEAEGLAAEFDGDEAERNPQTDFGPDVVEEESVADLRVESSRVDTPPCDLVTEATTGRVGTRSGVAASAVGTGARFGADPHQFIIRTLLWRMYLNLIPVPSSAEDLETTAFRSLNELFTQRMTYATAKQVYLEKRFKELGLPQEQAIDMESAVYQASGKGNLILMDIRRSYSKRDPGVPHQSLFFLLSVWAHTHAEVGYHQGMHEIGGQMLQLLHYAKHELHRESMLKETQRAGATPPQSSLTQARSSPQFRKPSPGAQNSQPNKARGNPSSSTEQYTTFLQLLSECSAPKYAEADAYTMFNAMMESLGIMELFREDDSYLDQLEYTDEEEVEELCRHPLGRVHVSIREFLLPAADRQLFEHLLVSGVLKSPYLFTARWVRNLFTRELNPRQCFVVWDAILAVEFAKFSQNLVRTERGVSPLGRSVTPPMVLDSAPNPNHKENGGQEFSRLTAALATVLLIRERDLLLTMRDDFSILRHLTRSPMVPPTVNPYALLYDAFRLCGFGEGYDFVAHHCGNSSWSDVAAADTAQLRRRYAVVVGLNFEHAAVLTKVIATLEELKGANAPSSERSKSQLSGAIESLRGVAKSLAMQQ